MWEGKGYFIVGMVTMHGDWCTCVQSEGWGQSLKHSSLSNIVRDQRQPQQQLRCLCHHIFSTLMLKLLILIDRRYWSSHVYITNSFSTISQDQPHFCLKLFHGVLTLTFFSYFVLCSWTTADKWGWSGDTELKPSAQFWQITVKWLPKRFRLLHLVRKFR